MSDDKTQIPKCPKCKKILLLCKCESEDLVKAQGLSLRNFLYWK